VSKAILRLSRRLSPLTYRPAYTPFTPSDSGQRLHPPYYRGCWHGVSRCLFLRYRQADGSISVLLSEKEFTIHRTFILHAAWLRQGCPHCARFLTAASRRSLARVSVPVWLIILSDQLRIVGMVGRYPTIYLIRRR